jgi:sugar/nucleoside kinase (ribokinase family)
MKRHDVATFGPVFADHVLTGLSKLPAPGEEVFAQGYRREVGGGCFATACGLAALGAAAACFAVVGREDGQWLLDRVQSFGVNTDAVRFSDAPTGVTVAASLPADRAFLTFDGANCDLWPWLESDELVNHLIRARHVHFACPLPPKTGRRLIQTLHAEKTTVSLDAGWQEEWMGDENIWPLLADVDWFLPNESEARFLTGESSAEKMLETFAARGAGGVVIKLGPDGAATRHGAAIIKAKALDVPVIDTTGAGDVFNAGFLHAFLAGLPVEACLERGAICGSLSTTKAGALEAFPKLNEVLKHHRHDPKR